SPLSLPGKKSEPIYPIPTKAKEANNKPTEISKTKTLFKRRFKDHFNIPEIQFVKPLSPLSKPCRIPPKNDRLLICDNFPIREYNQGTMVNDTKKDSNVDTITVTQNWRKMSETNPDDIAIGKNTTTITSVIAETVKPISFAPSKEARTLFFPISVASWMFSVTRMGSATKIQTMNDKTKSDISVNEWPKVLRKIEVATKEKGIATTAMNASRNLCRKTNII